MGARIVGATLRDLSYIASNLRPEDQAEVDCQFEHWSPGFLAQVSLKDHAYVVLIDGNPEAAFGAQSTTHKGLWIAWSWGTKRMWRAVPRITEFVRTVMIPDIITQGGWRCEARAMAEHTTAHNWLTKMGAQERCRLDGWGRNGETFTLFDWTREHVLCKPIPNASATASCAATGAEHRQRCSAGA